MRICGSFLPCRLILCVRGCVACVAFQFELPHSNKSRAEEARRHLAVASKARREKPSGQEDEVTSCEQALECERLPPFQQRAPGASSPTPLCHLPLASKLATDFFDCFCCVMLSWLFLHVMYVYMCMYEPNDVRMFPQIELPVPSQLVDLPVATCMYRHFNADLL